MVYFPFLSIAFVYLQRAFFSLQRSFKPPSDFIAYLACFFKLQQTG